jgi:hypothetical protein
MRLNIVIGLLGLVAGLLIAIAAGTGAKPAYAQGAAPDGSMLAVSANYNNQQEDLVWILDAKAKRLACYKYKNNAIELLGARNIKFDLMVEEFVYQGAHVKPSDIEKKLKERQKNNEKP